MEQAKFRMPTAYTILFLLIVLVAIATWIIPAGAYEYVNGIPVAGSYREIAANPQGTSAVLQAAFSGAPMQAENLNLPSLLLFALAFCLLRKFKLNPIGVMLGCGAAGLALGLLGL